jgi:ribosome-associated heat shock protein Hsp15
MRIDKWLWVARFFKTRSLASDAVSGGKIRLNGTPPKPAREIKVGDRLEIATSEVRWEVVVQALADQRRPAPEARLLYAETAESCVAREAEQLRRKVQHEPAAEIHGRPTKRDRRALGRFSGS